MQQVCAGTARHQVVTEAPLQNIVSGTANQRVATANQRVAALPATQRDTSPCIGNGLRHQCIRAEIQLAGIQQVRTKRRSIGLIVTEDVERDEADVGRIDRQVAVEVDSIVSATALERDVFDFRNGDRHSTERASSSCATDVEFPGSGAVFNEDIFAKGRGTLGRVIEPNDQFVSACRRFKRRCIGVSVVA